MIKKLSKDSKEQAHTPLHYYNNHSPNSIIHSPSPSKNNLETKDAGLASAFTISSKIWDIKVVTALGRELGESTK